MADYGEKLAESIRQERQRYIDAMDRRDERIAGGYTDEDDCFMSIRAEEQGISKCDMQLEILKGDGT